MAVGIVGYTVMKASRYDVLGAMFMDPVGLPALSRGILMRITSWIAGLTLVLVVADLRWSRFTGAKNCA